MTSPTLRRLSAAALLVSLVSGCGGGAGNTPLSGASVAGTVTYKGKPVTGGTLRLVSLADENKSTTGKIDHAGRFEVQNAPLGECKVIVETESAKVDPSAFMGRVPEGSVDKSKVPPPMKYVQIPRKYNDLAQTPGRLTVEKGSQTKDVILTD